MIYEVLQVITEEVNSYLGESPVAIENIATVDSEPTDSSGTTSSNDIILTLLNLQEEFTLKNTSHRVVTGTTVTYKNPKIFLNLYILFSINNPLYTESLKSLSKIITFFSRETHFYSIEHQFFT